ncbi:MAG TPA: DUF2851 family protein [Ferruginibacter sp.]|nr:DUF2851 family protein [Ferruginibacter sp.]HMP21900.1 DUF2851 family protein [Ferruginibacter sp.]
MNEALLQYIWKFQHFNTVDLFITAGENLQILHPGQPNTNQGPDFINAKIKTGNTIWAGNIELHVQASAWQQHGHSIDKNYNNIILHVVWENDAALNLPFPVFELKNRVPGILLERYRHLVTHKAPLPCAGMIAQVPAITWITWKERLLIERLEQKSAQVYQYLQDTHHHWEEVFWWLLAKNFGATVNSIAFEKIARSIPVQILAKHKNQLHQTEALLMGQAGLLQQNFTEDYPAMLQREYHFLQKKYQLHPVLEPVHFLRMRPQGFPTIRLAQLAALVHHSSHLFSKIKEAATLKEVQQLFDIMANDYWHYHYVFEVQSAFKPKKLGIQMLNTILINTVVPLVFAYGHLHNDNNYTNKALQWLEALLPEKNAVTRVFSGLAVDNKSAYDSQALLQLKKKYCDARRCLECAVGNKILGR